MLVNNAGLMRQTPVLEISVAEWDELFAVNLRAVFFLTQAVAGPMAERGRGAVVSIASVNALRTESPEAHYNATKAGIVSIMRSFANELSHLGLRFNCVAPGETVSADEAATYDDDDRARTREYLQRVPLRRVALPVEMARRRAASWPPTTPRTSTAQTIVADGGELTGDWYDTARAPAGPRAPRGHRPRSAMSAELDDVDRRIIDQLQEEGRRPVHRDRPRRRDLRGQRPPAGRLADRARRDPDRRRDQPDRPRDDPGVRLGPARRAPGSSRRHREIAAIREVDYVAVCTGPTDLLVGAVCRDNQHLLEVTTQIREVPGVAETDTAVILSELKDSYRWSEAVRPD